MRELVEKRNNVLLIVVKTDHFVERSSTAKRIPEFQNLGMDDL
jgi:hypothetical protein